MNIGLKIDTSPVTRKHNIVLTRRQMEEAVVLYLLQRGVVLPKGDTWVYAHPGLTFSPDEPACSITVTEVMP